MGDGCEDKLCREREFYVKEMNDALALHGVVLGDSFRLAHIARDCAINTIILVVFNL